MIYIYIKVPRGCVGHDDNDFAKVRLTGAQFEEYKPLLGRGFMLHGDDETCGIGYDSPHAWELLQTNLAKHSRVFTDNDFANVNYEEVGLNSAQFEEYKKSLLGRPIPIQDITNDELFALGYDGLQPWVQCCIEEPMPNWD